MPKWAVNGPDSPSNKKQQPSSSPLLLSSTSYPSGMRRFLVNCAYRATYHRYPNSSTFNIKSLQSTFRFFSSSKDITSTESPTNKIDVEDVNNQDFRKLINKHYVDNNEEVIPEIMEAILRRKLTGKHEQTDDELMEQLDMVPINDISDAEIESDFEEAYETENDEALPDLYNARQYVVKKMIKDKYFNMDDQKWDQLITEGIQNGHLKDTKECEDILEDMMSWDKLLPDEIKKKVEAKYNELGDMCERGELEPEAAYELFKDFEDQMVIECQEIMAAEPPPPEDLSGFKDKNKELDDPPGEGPILRWQSRCVFAPGGDAWHPKNRKVKLSVTVKELGLSKNGTRRLREIVGKRYHPGKDELTITSERFEHREENRKDCLRTLLALFEEAAKADKLVEEVRTCQMKEKLAANPAFMERLRAKKLKALPA